MLIMGEEVEPARPGTAPDLASAVGNRIRRLRRARGWSVRELADAAGTSRRMLTRVELGQANPSLLMVDRIAAALDTDVAALVVPEPADPSGPASAAQGSTSGGDGTGSPEQRLGMTRQPWAELSKWTLRPGDQHNPGHSAGPGGQHVHHVLTGQLTIVLAERSLVIEAGQTATVDRRSERAYRNEGGSAVVFLRVAAGHEPGADPDGRSTR